MATNRTVTRVVESAPIKFIGLGYIEGKLKAISNRLQFLDREAEIGIIKLESPVEHQQLIADALAITLEQLDSLLKEEAFLVTDPKDFALKMLDFIPSMEEYRETLDKYGEEPEIHTGREATYFAFKDRSWIDRLLEEHQKWSELLEKEQPKYSILGCGGTETFPTKEEAHQWALENNFEKPDIIRTVYALHVPNEAEHCVMGDEKAFLFDSKEVAEIWRSHCAKSIGRI